MIPILVLFSGVLLGVLSRPAQLLAPRLMRTSPRGVMLAGESLVLSVVVTAHVVLMCSGGTTAFIIGLLGAFVSLLVWWMSVRRLQHGWEMAVFDTIEYFLPDLREEDLRPLTGLGEGGTLSPGQQGDYSRCFARWRWKEISARWGKRGAQASSCAKN